MEMKMQWQLYVPFYISYMMNIGNRVGAYAAKPPPLTPNPLGSVDW